MTPENLGPLEAWQIREFPRELRRQIIDEAKRRQMSPGELATRVFLAAATDWEPHLAVSPAKNEAPPAGLLERAQAARALAQTAIMLRKAEMPEKLCGAANRSLKDTLRTLGAPKLVLEAPRHIGRQPAEIAAGEETEQPLQGAGLVEAEHP